MLEYHDLFNLKLKLYYLERSNRDIKMALLADNAACSFMSTYFLELPVELQRLILTKTYRLPDAKFQVGESVRYSDNHIQRMKKMVSENDTVLNIFSNNQYPFNKITITGKWGFSFHNYEWVYEYEYNDGSHKGVAAESYLVSN